MITYIDGDDDVKAARKEFKDQPVTSNEFKALKKAIKAATEEMRRIEPL
jgi:hypothetical protein